MKTFDYRACYVTEVPLLLCNEHFPVTITSSVAATNAPGGEVKGKPVVLEIDDDRVTPLFADAEVDSYPVCDACGIVHDYVSLTEDGMRYEIEQLDERIANTAFPEVLEILYEERDRLVEQLGEDPA